MNRTPRIGLRLFPKANAKGLSGRRGGGGGGGIGGGEEEEEEED